MDTRKVGSWKSWLSRSGRVSLICLLMLGVSAIGVTYIFTPTSQVQAQVAEVCDDDIDNDEDGWVDCQDADCLGNVACPCVDSLRNFPLLTGCDP